MKVERLKTPAGTPPSVERAMDELHRRYPTIDGRRNKSNSPSKHGDGWRVVIRVHDGRAVLFAINDRPVTYRSDDDGRCLTCEGWGCWDCNSTGGY